MPLETGGWARQVTVRERGIAKSIAGVNMRLNAGGVRELHRHPNVDEWQYCMEGQAGMGIFAASGQARSFHFRAGDVGYLPLAMGPYIDNTSATPLRFLDPSW